MRLCRWVVPVRGSPQMMIGRATTSSRISGWRRTRSSISSRLLRSPTRNACWAMTPRRLEPASSRCAVVKTSSRSSKSEGPKSSRPVASVAAAFRASGSRRRAAPAVSIMARMGATSALKRGSARSSMVTASGRGWAVMAATSLPLGAAPGWRRAGTSGTRSAPGGGRRSTPSWDVPGLGARRR